MSKSTPIVIPADAYTYEVVTDDSGASILKVTVDADQYDVHRPDGITSSIEKEVDQYRQAFVAGVINGAVDTTAEYMEKNPNISSADIECDATIGINAKVLRARNGRNPRKPDEPIVTYGSTTVAVTTTYGRKIGPIKTATEAMAAAIKEKLSPNCTE